MSAIIRPLNAATVGLAAFLTLALTTGLAPAAGVDPFETMQALRAAQPAPAPAITFQALVGGPARLSDLEGRPVLLTFFTTW